MIYTLQVTPGKDDKAVAELRHIGINAYSPGRVLPIRRGGKKSCVIALLLPGYIFIDTEFSPEIYHNVLAIPQVISWLGSPPTPLKGDEEEFIRLIINGGVPLPISTARCMDNGEIVIIDGWLKGRETEIKHISFHKCRAWIDITICGKRHGTSVGIVKA